MPLGAGAYSPFEASFRDKGGEVGTFAVYGLLVTEENWADNIVLATAFNTALVGAVLGQEVQWSYGGVQTIVNPSGKAASASAQRENKALFRYHDIVNLKVMTGTVPTINLPILAFETDANDFFALASPAAILALVNAWQAFVVNPETNNLTHIDSGQYVGRNR